MRFRSEKFFTHQKFEQAKGYDSSRSESSYASNNEAQELMGASDNDSSNSSHTNNPAFYREQLRRIERSRMPEPDFISIDEDAPKHVFNSVSAQLENEEVSLDHQGSHALIQGKARKYVLDHLNSNINSHDTTYELSDHHDYAQPWYDVEDDLKENAFNSDDDEVDDPALNDTHVVPLSAYGRKLFKHKQDHENLVHGIHYADSEYICDREIDLETLKASGILDSEDESFINPRGRAILEAAQQEEWLKNHPEEAKKDSKKAKDTDKHQSAHDALRSITLAKAESALAPVFISYSREDASFIESVEDLDAEIAASSADTKPVLKKSISTRPSALRAKSSVNAQGKSDEQSGEDAHALKYHGNISALNLPHEDNVHDEAINELSSSAGADWYKQDAATPDYAREVTKQELSDRASRVLNHISSPNSDLINQALDSDELTHSKAYEHDDISLDDESLLGAKSHDAKDGNSKGKGNDGKEEPSFLSLSKQELQDAVAHEEEIYQELLRRARADENLS